MPYIASNRIIYPIKAKGGVLKEGISIIIPTYNEEKAILSSIRELHQTLTSTALRYQLIVVNDCSSDGTLAVLEAAGGAETLGITLVNHRINRGYGAAIKTGVKYADYAFLCITDSDGTYPNAMIPKLYAEMDGRDMVVGARIGANVHIPWLRRIPKAFINALASYVVGEHIPDLNSGLRIFTKELYNTFIRLYPKGFSFTSTITLAALTNGYEVMYVKIDYYKRKGRSKIRPIRSTLDFIMLIVRMCVLFNPLRIFIPLSLISFLIGVGIFLYGILVSGKFYDGTFIIIFLSSVQIFGIGLLADVISRK